MRLPFISLNDNQRTSGFAPGSIIHRSPLRQLPGWLPSSFRALCILLVLVAGVLNVRAQSGGCATPSFAPAVPYSSGGGNLNYIITGDFNSDGKPDLAVTNAGTNNVDVLLGNANGTFSIASTYPSGGGAPFDITTGDFDGDGELDLAVANFDSDNVGVLLGNGDGTFAAATTFLSGGNEPVSISTGDFNSDGKVDLAVTNLSSDNVGVLLGNGDGTFLAANTYPTGGDVPFGIATGDFNGDGTLDLAVTNGVSNDVSILPGNGNGTFAAATTYSTGGGAPREVTTGDFNGDGKLDLVVANLSSDRVGIFLNNGDGTFASVATYPTGGGQPYGISTGDFNGDGKVDLAVTNLSFDDVGVLLGNGDGTFASATTFLSGGDQPLGIATGDFNGDGRPDLVVANSNNNLGVLLNSCVPVITATAASGTITACAGTASTSTQSFTASATNLTDNLVATAPPGFDISTSPTSGFATSLTLTPAGGTVSDTPIYVRSSATATGPIAGSVTLASAGATPQSVAVSGTVNPLPSVDAGPDQSVILGYGSGCATLTATPSGGSGGNYGFSWNPSNLTGPTVSVCPQTTTTYTVTLTDGNGCRAADQVTVTVKDVRCGNQNQNVQICYYGVTLCVNQKTAERYLKLGATLGPCGSGNTRIGYEPEPDGAGLRVQVLGNPVSGRQVEALIEGAAGQALRVELVSAQGRTVAERQVERAGALERVALPAGPAPGVLLLRASTATQSQTVRLLKVD